jgi:hypothetical protein
MNQTEPSLQAIFEMMGASLTAPSIGVIGTQHPDIVREFESCDPFKLAANIAALMLLPDLQCSCVRLETLAHLALLHGAGKRKPAPKLLRRAFAQLRDGTVGRMEDPAEDVFVTSVATSRGNFLCLEGIWESAGFFLQRFVNVVEEMPDEEPFVSLRESVFALLALSDLICQRAQLERWQAGADTSPAALGEALAAKAHLLRKQMVFTEDDLQQHGIAMASLEDFIFDPANRFDLGDAVMGNSPLDHRPVLWRDDKVCFALPTAVSAAIRYRIITFAAQHTITDQLLRGLGREYARTFKRIPFLGGRIGAQVRFQRTVNGMMAGGLMPVDTGRYLTLIFVLDTLKDFERDGLNGVNTDLESLETHIGRWQDEATAAAEVDKDFRDGITLIVSCGVGRGIMSLGGLPDRPRWRQEFISAADLYTLSWTKGFDPLALWRLLDAEGDVENAGVELLNVNGLLNRIAWRRRLDGHLVPHRMLSEDFAQGDHQAVMMIDQTSMKRLRREALELGDPHAVRDVMGHWVKVRKEGTSFFAEDAREPGYFPEDVASTENLPHVYAAKTRPWWVEIAISDGARDSITYERWKMLQTWNARISPVLDASLKSLPAGPMRWQVRFAADQNEDQDVDRRWTLDEARAAITATTDAAHNTVLLDVAANFDQAFLHPENIAERALVERAVEGFVALAGEQRDDAAMARLVDHIVRDPKARQTHRFRNGGFRDRIRMGARRDKAVFVAEEDEAALRVGLGWRVRDRGLGGAITEKSACTNFLNTSVRQLEDALCAEVRAFNRAALIGAALKNHEAAASERDQWERTMSAVVALHSDKDATYEAIARRESQLAAVFQTCRTLCEIAICESPETGGLVPGTLDLARLMARTALLINLGGWSDAIWLDAAEPRLQITALGDVHLNHGFIEEVVAPFGRAATDVRTNQSIRNYGRNLEEVPFTPSVEHNFAPEFLTACEEELGAGIDEMRIFIEHVENLAVIAGENVFTVPRSQLLTPTVEGRTVPPERTAALVSALSIPRRNNWRDIPDGFEARDIQAWRYRRRLSLLRRPLVQLDDKPDPTLMVAPGLLRDGFGYILANYHQGDFPQRQLSPKMRSWRGRTTAERGVAFNAEVAQRLRELGWQARADINVSTILGAAFKRYGDVDVLAWNPATGRILLIECKDLQFGKTFGEIAEQLAEFRGQTRADGSPDKLRRHLDRIDVLTTHADALAKFVGVLTANAIEGHLVFKNPVPMQFAGARMAAQIRVHIVESLDLR